MDNPLITIEITDCDKAVAELIIALNVAQIPAKVTIQSHGVDRTITVIDLYGGH